MVKEKIGLYYSHEGQFHTNLLNTMVLKVGGVGIFIRNRKRRNEHFAEPDFKKYGAVKTSTMLTLRCYSSKNIKNL